MSDFWSGYVIFIVALNVFGCMFLLWWTRRNPVGDDEHKEGDTMGHAFDGIEEYNNPLPKWWLKLFWATIAFTIIYLALYPGLGNLPGYWGWTSHNQWVEEVEVNNRKYQPIFDQMAALPIEELAQDAHAMDTGRRLFGNNCAVCHGSDARGAKGFPNLTDSDWLYGGDAAAIKHTIASGRKGAMPPMGAALGSDKTVEQVALYVASLSKPELAQTHADDIAQGQSKFMFCAACHGADGTGNTMLGAPNLTDNTWLYGGSLADIKYTINNGRQGNMPAQQELLSEAKIHILAAYVYSLSQK